MTMTPRQVRRATRQMEYYATQMAQAADPQGQAQVAFSRLRALAPPHDQVWNRIRSALEEFIHEKERQTS